MHGLVVFFSGLTKSLTTLSRRLATKLSVRPVLSRNFSIALLTLVFLVSACGPGFKGARMDGGQLNIGDGGFAKPTEKSFTSGSQDYSGLKSLPTLAEIDKLDTTQPLEPQLAAIAATELNMPSAKMVINVDQRTMSLSADIGIGSQTEHFELQGDFKESFDAKLGYWSSTNLKAVDPTILKQRRIQATALCLKANVCDEVVVEIYFLSEGKLYRRQFNQHLNSLLVGKSATSNPRTDGSTDSNSASTTGTPPATNSSTTTDISASTPPAAGKNSTPLITPAPGTSTTGTPAAPTPSGPTQVGVNSSGPKNSDTKPSTLTAFENWFKSKTSGAKPAPPTPSVKAPEIKPPVKAPGPKPDAKATDKNLPANTPDAKSPAKKPADPAAVPSSDPAADVSTPAAADSADDQSDESEPAGIESEYVMPEATVDSDSIPQLAEMVKARHDHPTPAAPTSDASGRPQATGSQDSGKLANGKFLPPEGVGYVRNVRFAMRGGVDVSPSYGTDAVVNFLLQAAKILGVGASNLPKMIIGQIANPHGGVICDAICMKDPKHRHSVSHQNGLDVDVGFFSVTIPHTTFWSPLPDPRNPHQSFDDYDFERNWTLLKLGTRYGRTDLEAASLIQPGTLNGVLTDVKIKARLCQFADGQGENPRTKGTEANIILNRIQPWDGHRNHFHMRFLCPTTHLGCHDVVVATKNGPGC